MFTATKDPGCQFSSSAVTALSAQIPFGIAAQLPLFLLSGLWWRCAALLNYCHTEPEGSSIPATLREEWGRISFYKGWDRTAALLPVPQYC